ncbi:MAG: PorT family protein [Bacteroidales bacterium]|nr:PorT family protein [Bacteroidales bacterium]
MRKYCLYIGILLLLISVALPAKAQRFVGFASAGVNLGQIEGDDVHGFRKVGVNGGLGVALPLTRDHKWSLSLELLYAQKGSYKHYSPKFSRCFDTIFYHPDMFLDVNRAIPFDSTMKCNISLDYVQIPLLAHYEDMQSGFKFGLGFAWGRLVRAKEIYNGFTRTTNIRSGTYRKSDWSVIVDVEARLYKNLSLDVRWEYSMVPIRTMHYMTGRTESDGSFNLIRDEYIKMHNHVFSIRLSYFFNEKYELNDHVNRKGNRMGTKWIKYIPEY